MTQQNSEFQGYKVVPLRVKPSAQNCHEVFIKEHYIRVQDSDKPRGRTLFLLNIPPYVDLDSLKQFFSRFGKIQSIIFSQKPGKDEDGTEMFQQSIDKYSNFKKPFCFKVAYIVFTLTKSLQNALQTIESIDLFDRNRKAPFIKTGIEKWTEEYLNSIHLDDELQSEIEEYMSNYDMKEKETMENEKNTEDDEGWTKVGKRGKNAGFQQKESVINKLEEKLKNSQKKKELKNFYTFQIRESKMKNIVSLRKKFEEDKQKIEALKKSRRFNPF